MKKKKSETEKIQYIKTNLSLILENDIKNMYKHGIIPIDTMYRKLRILQYKSDLEKYKNGDIKNKPLMNDIAYEMGKSKAYVSKYINDNKINVSYKMFFQEWLLSKGEEIVSHFEKHIQDEFFMTMSDLMYDVPLNEYQIDKKLAPGTIEIYWSNLMSGIVIKDKVIEDNRDEVVISLNKDNKFFVVKGGRTDTFTGAHRKVEKTIENREEFIKKIYKELKKIYRVEDIYYVNKTNIANLTYCIMLLSYVDIYKDKCKKSSRFVN